MIQYICILRFIIVFHIRLLQNTIYCKVEVSESLNFVVLYGTAVSKNIFTAPDDGF
jgi:hypothetical protein